MIILNPSIEYDANFYPTNIPNNLLQKDLNQIEYFLENPNEIFATSRNLLEYLLNAENLPNYEREGVYELKHAQEPEKILSYYIASTFVLEIFIRGKELTTAEIRRITKAFINDQENLFPFIRLLNLHNEYLTGSFSKNKEQYTLFSERVNELINRPVPSGWAGVGYGMLAHSIYCKTWLLLKHKEVTGRQKHDSLIKKVITEYKRLPTLLKVIIFIVTMPIVFPVIFLIITYFYDFISI
jgi:hypothetical protein